MRTWIFVEHTTYELMRRHSMTGVISETDTKPATKRDGVWISLTTEVYQRLQLVMKAMRGHSADAVIRQLCMKSHRLGWGH